MPEVVPEVDSPWRTELKYFGINVNVSLLDNFHYR